MAYPVASVIAQSSGTAAASVSFGSWFDSQQTGDHIVIAASNDGGGTTLTITNSHASDPTLGWVEIGGPAPDNAGVRTGVWYRQHTGTALAAPTISGATDEWAACATLIRDADTTTVLCAAAGITEQTTNTTAPVAPSVTTGTDGCLILRILGRDGSNTSFPQTFGQAVSLARCTDNFGTALNACETLIEAHGQVAAGATGTYTWDCAANDSGRNITLAIRNKSGGGVYATPSCVGLTTVLRTNATLTLTSLSTWHATMFSGQTVQPGSATSQTSLPQVANLPQQGVYGFGRTISVTQPSAGGAAGVYGVAATLASAVDLSAHLTAICFRLSGIGPNTVDDTGPGLYFRDGAGGWAVLRPFNKVQSATEFATYIAHLPTETQIDGSGTIDWANITHIGTAQIITGTVGTNTGRGIDIRNVLTCALTGGFVGLVGGNAARPATPRDLAAIMASSFGVRLASLQGGGQNLVTLPARIGDGSTATVFSSEGQSLEYPVPGAQRGYAARANDQDLRILASASDVIDLTAGIYATAREQDLTLDASTSASATYGFAGTFIGWNVIWKDGLHVNAANFISCDEIDAQSAQFNNCTIRKTISADAAIAFDANSSMSGTTIDVTGTAAAYHLELGAAVTAFTLTNVTFTGTPGTDKVHVKATTGTVTISLSGSTSLAAGDVTSDGATVVIASGADVTLTGLVAGSEIRAFVGTPDSATLLSATESSGTSYTFNQSQGGNAGFIVVRKLDYVFVKIDLTYSGSNVSIPVQQRPDRDYLNP